MLQGLRAFSPIGQADTTDIDTLKKACETQLKRPGPSAPRKGGVDMGSSLNWGTSFRSPI